MESHIKTDGYEVIPVRMAIPMAPIPSKSLLDNKFQGAQSLRENVPTQKLVSPRTSVKAAQRLSEKTLRPYRYRVLRDRDLRAFFELIERHPFFLQHPWVRDQYEQFKDYHKKKRGRPLDSFAVSPIVIYGLVQACRDYELASSIPKAFNWLSEWLQFMSADSIRNHYYQAKDDPRFQAILIEFPENKEIVSAEEAFNRLVNVEALQPGGTVTRTATSDEGNSIELTFTAE